MKKLQPLSLSEIQNRKILCENERICFVIKKPLVEAVLVPHAELGEVLVEKNLLSR